MSLIQSVCSEYLFDKTRQKIIASIDGTEKAIHQAREDAAKQDKVVAVEFDRVMRLSPQVIVLGHKKMDSIRQKMNEEHAHVQ